MDSDRFEEQYVSLGPSMLFALSITVLLWLVSVAPWVGVFVGATVFVIQGVDASRLERRVKQAEAEKEALEKQVVALRTLLQRDARGHVLLGRHTKSLNSL